MKLLRSIGAVLAGYLLIGITVELMFHLTGYDPHEPASVWFMIVSTVYGMLVCALAGYVTARLAGRQALFHAALLACLVALIALISFFASLGSASIWTQITALLFMAPAVLIGAMIRLKGT